MYILLPEIQQVIQMLLSHNTRLKAVCPLNNILCLTKAFSSDEIKHYIIKEIVSEFQKPVNY